MIAPDLAGRGDPHRGGAWFRHVMEQLPVGVLTYDARGTVTFCNRAAAEILGVSGAELVGRSSYDGSWDVVREDGGRLAAHEHPVPRVLLTGLAVRHASLGYLPPRKAERVWLQVSAAPVPGSERDPEGREVVCVVEDVTAGRNAVAELRQRDGDALTESEREFRAVFEMAGAGAAVTVPPEGRYARVNRKFCEMTGYAEAELLGRTFTEITHPDDRERDRAAYDSILRGAAAEVQSEKRYVRKDGSCVWVMVSGRMIRDGAGRVVRSIATVQDITERKAAEESLRRQKEQLQAVNAYLQEELSRAVGGPEIVLRSPAMRSVLDQALRIAVTDTTVLLSGETGTGKELVARAVHGHSRRKDKPLVRVNCAALPAHLIESELFGHEKGAFSGAVARRQGRFELADGGTLFLDEIGDLPLESQPKLLRVLQEGEFERIGSSRTLRVDVRVIAATNRTLSESVRNGTFRADLYYRLNVYPIEIPPLRARPEDVEPLATRFLARAAERLGREFDPIGPDVVEALRGHSWPGNVRELQNVMERAAVSAAGRQIRLPAPWDAPVVPLVTGPVAPRAAAGAAPLPGLAAAFPVPHGPLHEVERDYIRTVLDRAGWRIEGPQGAARTLGLHPSTLRARMKKLSLYRPGTGEDVRPDPAR